MTPRSLADIVNEPRRTRWRGTSGEQRASDARWWTDGVPGPRDTAIFDAKSGSCHWDVPEVYSFVVEREYTGTVHVQAPVDVHGPFTHAGGTVKFDRGTEAGVYWPEPKGTWSGGAL